MTDAAVQRPFVACCKPLPAQHATNDLNRATEHPTPAQRPSLKALALLALERNSACNAHATNPEKPRNNEALSKDGLLRTYEPLAVIRTRLLTLAVAEGLPASAVDTIPADELHLYAELDDADLLLPLHLRACCPSGKMGKGGLKV